MRWAIISGLLWSGALAFPVVNNFMLIVVKGTGFSKLNNFEEIDEWIGICGDGSSENCKFVA